MTENDDAAARLTEAQRECLRLVMAGYKSKEIAFELGIGVDAVNKRLAGAKETLGASSRFAAARQLTAWEAGSGGHSLVSQTLAVEPDHLVTHPSSRTANEGVHDDQPVHNYRVQEAQLSYNAPVPSASPSSPSDAVESFGLRQLVASPLGTFLVFLVAGILLALLTRL